MIWLWVATAVLSAGAATLIVLRAALVARAGGGESPALGVYRRQMAEIDELAERGVLAESERRGARAETGRRLLAAAERDDGPLSASRPGLILAAAAGAALLALAAYLVVGAPGLADQPFFARLAAWRAADPQSLDAPRMAAILRAIAAQRPADPEPLRQLAIAEFAAGEPDEAAQALRKAIAIAPRQTRLWEMLGEMQTIRLNGEVDAGAKDAFVHALALDPKSDTARYFLARDRIANGDTAGGLAQWRQLAGDLPPGDPRRTQLEADIDQVTKTGRLEPNGPQPGPQVAQSAIQGMVDGLAARLRARPDDPQGWVRLVRAYTVLGESAQRDAALDQARRRYVGRPDIQRQLQLAASASP